MVLCRDDATAIPRARWSVPISATPLATLGGRSTQRHHGVDGVPTPERTVDPVAISLGAPESLRSRPQLENSAPGRQGDRHQVAVFSTVTSRCRDERARSCPEPATGSHSAAPIPRRPGSSRPAAGAARETIRCSTGATHAAEADASRTGTKPASANLRVRWPNSIRRARIGSRMACQADERTGNLSELPRSKPRSRVGSLASPSPAAEFDAAPEVGGDPFRTIRGHPTQQRANSRASVRDNMSQLQARQYVPVLKIVGDASRRQARSALPGRPPPPD